MPLIGGKRTAHPLSAAFSGYSRAKILPLGGQVAAIAQLAELAAMHIIIVVAAIAGSWHDYPFIHYYFMARVTADLLMRAIQLEFRAGIVIEIPCLP